jgi:hypothetical protein
MSIKNTLYVKYAFEINHLFYFVGFPRPKNPSLCLRLTEFTLLEPRIGFVISDIKSILGYMENLIKLTLKHLIQYLVMVLNLNQY